VLQSSGLKEAARACPLLDGDPEAWAACCSERFFPLARRIAGDSDLARDALQESWAKILEAVHMYRGGDPACAWVRAIVANSAADTRRKRRAEVPVGAGMAIRWEAPGKSPEAAAAEKQLLHLVSTMIAALPETYRQVLELRHVRGLSTGEAAGLLHTSRANVSVRLNRAVSMLRKRLQARGVL